jgi:hypothetical protein
MSTLFFDSVSGRMGIMENGKAEFLLHCGETFELLVHHLNLAGHGIPKWHTVRIEHTGLGWVLCGLPAYCSHKATDYEGSEARFTR